MLKLFISTPGKQFASGINVTSVTVPGAYGEMTILEGHATLISTIGHGILFFETEDKKKNVAAVSRGFVQVSKDVVTILADRLEMANEISLERAKKAQAKAEAALSAKEQFDTDIEKWQEKWQEKLQRSMIRQQAAQFLLPPH